MAALQQQNNIKGFIPRSCDGCRAAAAILYCRVDTAFFCGSCDCAVAGHERVWMCEVCEQAPAVVTCKADAASLCSTCDADIHSANPLAHRHERLPIIPLLDSLSVAAACSSAPFSAALASREDDDAETWLIQNPSSKVLMAEFLCSESDLLDFGLSNSQNNLEKVTLNGSFENSTRTFTLSDSIVPTQLKKNLTLSDDSNRLFENSFDIDFSQPDKLQHNELSSNDQQMFPSFVHSAQHSESSSENGVVPDGNANSMSEVSYTFTKAISNAGDVVHGGSSAGTGVPVRATDREARVLRYREKRKNRKFHKTIRYASRKAYAETRPRIKGRFAKRKETNETLEEMEQIYGFGSGSIGFLLERSGYGVVPSFS